MEFDEGFCLEDSIFEAEGSGKDRADRRPTAKVWWREVQILFATALWTSAQVALLCARRCNVLALRGLWLESDTQDFVFDILESWTITVLDI
jgi:hypothetical protein